MPFLLCRVVHHQCSGSVVYRLLTVVVLLGFEKHVLCNVVDVANVPELVESLNDSSVTVAQLVKNISLSSKLWPTQITLTRNVTIRGGPDFPVLDLNYLLQRVRLYPGVVLVFDQVELQDIVKRLSSSISLLREASQSSSVVLLNSLRRQSVCLPLSVRQSIMEQSPRLPSFPGVQQFRMTDQTWCRWELDNLQRGKCFPAPNGLYVNTAVLVPFNEESREGGYGFIHLNTTLLCDTMVSQECLTQGRGPVDCYDEAMEKFERQSRSGGSSADPRVVVPVAVVGGALLVLLVAGLVYWRTWRHRRARRGVPGLCVSGYQLHTSSEATPGGYDDLTRVPQGLTLGRLLGTGSYGRVYEGWWQNQKVAVKVLVNDEFTIGRVNNEIQLSMSFRHPNIVQSLHNTTLKRAPHSGTHVSSESQGAGGPDGSTPSLTPPETKTLSTIAKSMENLTQGRDGEPGAGGTGSGAAPSSSTSLTLPLRGTQRSLQGGTTTSPQPASSGSSAFVSGSGMASGSGQTPHERSSKVPMSVLPFIGSVLVKGKMKGTPGGPHPSGTPSDMARSLVTSKDPTSSTLSTFNVSSPVIPSQVPSELAKPKSTKPLGRSRRQLVVSGDYYESWIIQEYCDHGPLSSALARGEFVDDLGVLILDNVLRRAKDVAAGMAYLHSCHVCHGDLKCENILLVSDQEDPYGQKAKVADFGLSRAIAEGKSHLSTRTYGTVTHMPPELLLEGRLAPPADVYSFGIILWEMLAARSPFHGMTAGEVIQKVVVQDLRPQFPRYIPLPVCQLAQDCWHKQPSKRPEFPLVMERLEALLQEVDKLQAVMRDLYMAPGSSHHSGSGKESEDMEVEWN